MNEPTCLGSGVVITAWLTTCVDRAARQMSRNPDMLTVLGAHGMHPPRSFTLCTFAIAVSSDRERTAHNEFAEPGARKCRSNGLTQRFREIFALKNESIGQHRSALFAWQTGERYSVIVQPKRRKKHRISAAYFRVEISNYGLGSRLGTVIGSMLSPTYRDNHYAPTSGKIFLNICSANLHRFRGVHHVP